MQWSRWNPLTKIQFKNRQVTRLVHTLLIILVIVLLWCSVALVVLESNRRGSPESLRTVLTRRSVVI